MARFLAPLCALVLSAGLVLPAHARPDPASALPVGTVLAQRTVIDQALDLVGHVKVCAWVTGFLEAVLFKGHLPAD